MRLLLLLTGLMLTNMTTATQLTLGVPAYATSLKPGLEAYDGATPLQLELREDKSLDHIKIIHPSVSLFGKLAVESNTEYLLKMANRKLKPEGRLEVQTFLFEKHETDLVNVTLKSQLAKQFSLLYLDQLFTHASLSPVFPVGREYRKNLHWQLHFLNGELTTLASSTMQDTPLALINIDKSIQVSAPAFVVDLLQSQFLIFLKDLLPTELKDEHFVDEKTLNPEESVFQKQQLAKAFSQGVIIKLKPGIMPSFQAYFEQNNISRNLYQFNAPESYLWLDLKLANRIYQTIPFKPNIDVPEFLFRWFSKDLSQAKTRGTTMDSFLNLVLRAGN